MIFICERSTAHVDRRLSAKLVDDVLNKQLGRGEKARTALIAYAPPDDCELNEPILVALLGLLP